MKVSRHEWHPFTISSPPELEDELWLHIRTLGNWTNKLHNLFEGIIKNDRKFRKYGRKPFSTEVKYEQKKSILGKSLYKINFEPNNMILNKQRKKIFFSFKE